jgi:hypothetical protein
MNANQDVLIFLSQVRIPVTASFIARNTNHYFYQVKAALDLLIAEHKVIAVQQGERLYYALM